MNIDKSDLSSKLKKSGRIFLEGILVLLFSSSTSVEIAQLYPSHNLAFVSALILSFIIPILSTALLKSLNDSWPLPFILPILGIAFSLAGIFAVLPFFKLHGKSYVAENIEELTKNSSAQILELRNLRVRFQEAGSAGVYQETEDDSFLVREVAAVPLEDNVNIKKKPVQAWVFFSDKKSLTEKPRWGIRLGPMDTDYEEFMLAKKKSEKEFNLSSEKTSALIRIIPSLSDEIRDRKTNAILATGIPFLLFVSAVIANLFISLSQKNSVSNIP